MLPLCMGLKICLDEDLYGFLTGVHFHSNRVVAELYLSDDRSCLE